MPRKQPPQGYLTSAEAAEILNCSVGMVYNYERAGQLHRKFPPRRKQGFYQESEVRALAGGLAEFFESEVDSLNADFEFSRATEDDTEGIYKVAASLFGSTTSAEARKPLIKLCPDGNYILKRNGKVVAYIHIQPLKHERLMAFMRGEIRGHHITADDLDCFAPGKPVECLVKSIGAVKTIGATEEAKRINQLNYLRRLLRGTAREMAKLGSNGIIITKLYATSETVTGIEMGFSAKMEQYGKPLKGGRFRFVLDIEKSDLPLLQPYKRALAKWHKTHDKKSEDVA